MDPALLREREAFKKRALAQPSIEKRKVKDRDDDKPSKKMKKEPYRPVRPPPTSTFDYKTMSGGSQNKFMILAKIVKHMKDRHREGNTYALTLEEILDETRQTDINQRHKHWLMTEALPNNPKIDIVAGETFKFKPKYNIKDKKALLRLLDKNDQQGMGGIMKDDVEEALPNVQRALKNLGDHITYITRPDKKQVLFYNDKSSAYEVDEEIKKLWRSVNIDGLDERKVEEYLQKQGITSMQDIEVKKATQKKRKGGKRKIKTTTKDNNHMDHILKDYSEINK